jgi:hypothetical protein
MQVFHLLIRPLSSCPNSLGEVFFSARTIVRAAAMEIRIAPSGWTPPTIRPNIYPHATPAKIDIPDVMIYLIDVRSNQINDNTDELANAISVEKAAPRVP